jgi:hypothetical protein
MLRRIPWMLLLVLLNVELGHSQYNAWIITIATGDTLSGCTLTSLDGDSLRVVWSGFPVSLPVESIRMLQYHRKSDFWEGALYGSAAGAMAGTMIVATSSGSTSSVSEVGAMGAVGGFVIGGLAAGYLSRDDRYDFSGLDALERKSMIAPLLLRSEYQTKGDKPK